MGEGKWQRICVWPPDIMHYQVHAVRSNALVQLLHDTVSDKQTLKDHLNTKPYWKSDIFYVNMFFRNDSYRVR